MGTTWDVRGLGILELPSGRSFAVAPCAKLPTTLPSPSLGFTSAFIRPRLFHGNTVDPLAPLLVAPNREASDWRAARGVGGEASMSGSRWRAGAATAEREPLSLVLRCSTVRAPTRPSFTSALASRRGAPKRHGSGALSSASRLLLLTSGNPLLKPAERQTKALRENGRSVGECAERGSGGGSCWNE
jgi:hypothetical protein